MLALPCQLLHNLSDFDSVQSSLTELFVFIQQVSVDVFEFADMIIKLGDHLVCSFQLLNQSHVFALLVKALPPEECSEARL